MGRQGKAADLALEGKQGVKRTSCWGELVQSHLIQRKPSAACSQKKKKGKKEGEKKSPDPD